MEILSFLPNRFEVAPVCKKFYDLICIIDKNRFALKVDELYDEVSWSQSFDFFKYMFDDDLEKRPRKMTSLSLFIF